MKRHLRARLATGECGLLLATHSLDIVERYGDRAALLLEGRIVRRWSREEIEQATAGGGLEERLAQPVA